MTCLEDSIKKVYATVNIRIWPAETGPKPAPKIIVGCLITRKQNSFHTSICPALHTCPARIKDEPFRLDSGRTFTRGDHSSARTQPPTTPPYTSPASECLPTRNLWNLCLLSRGSVWVGHDS